MIAVLVTLLAVAGVMVKETVVVVLVVVMVAVVVVVVDFMLSSAALHTIAGCSMLQSAHTCP
jgi:hypothetical protein